MLLASLRLVGGGGNAELLLAGAKAARDRRDFALTERLAPAAMEQGEGFEAQLLAAEAAHVEGPLRTPKRLAALVRSIAKPRTTPRRIRVALLRFDLAYFARGLADVSAIDSTPEDRDRPGLAGRAAGPAPLHATVPCTARRPPSRPCRSR